MKHLIVLVLALISAGPVLSQEGEIVSGGEEITVSIPASQEVSAVTTEIPVRTTEKVIVRERVLTPSNAGVNQLRREVGDLRRRLITATARRNFPEVEKIQGEIRSINARLSIVESNPLGGERGQRAMWKELHDAGVRSESHLRSRFDQRYLTRVEYERDRTAFPTTTTSTPASTPATPVVATTTETVPAAPVVAERSDAMWGAVIIIVVLLISVTILVGGYMLMGNYRRFVSGCDSLVQVGTRSTKKYRVRGDYGPFRVEYTDA